MVMVDGNSTPTRAPTTMALSNGGGAGVNGNCGSAGDSSCALLSSSQLELFSEYTGSLGRRMGGWVMRLIGERVDDEIDWWSSG